MANKKIQLLVSLVIILSICSTPFAQAKKKPASPKIFVPPSLPIDDEDYAVYSAVLKELYNAKSIALENQVSGCTGIGNNKEGEASWQKSLDALPGKLKKLSPKTIADFKGKSNVCRTLEAKFNSSVKLISKQERRAIFSGKDMKMFGELSGISIDASVRCSKMEFRGSVLFTHKGLSGPAILQLSSYWKDGDTIVIDLLPGLDIFGVFVARQLGKSKIDMHNLLSEYLPSRLSKIWCALNIQSKPVNQYNEKEHAKMNLSPC